MGWGTRDTWRRGTRSQAPPGKTAPRPPRSEPLLPAPLRLPAATLLAVCVAVTALLGVSFAGQRHAGWLDSAVDPRIRSALAGIPALLDVLADTGRLIPVSAMTLALVLACVATRRWSGAILAVVAEGAASALTEFGLKPLVDRTINGALSFPSGHATSMFALAGVCAILLLDPPRRDPPRRRVPGPIRLLLVFIALLLATAVATAMVALRAHYFTDAVAGAAVGTGMVLACSLTLDALARRRWRPAARPARPA
jgi:membrane-associated phospholipid phosphatase